MYIAICFLEQECKYRKHILGFFHWLPLKLESYFSELMLRFSYQCKQGLAHIRLFLGLAFVMGSFICHCFSHSHSTISFTWNLYSRGVPKSSPQSLECNFQYIFPSHCFGKLLSSKKLKFLFCWDWTSLSNVRTDFIRRLRSTMKGHGIGGYWPIIIMDNCYCQSWDSQKYPCWVSSLEGQVWHPNNRKGCHPPTTISP